VKAAAWVAVSLIAVVDVFQLALALGAPAGAAAWGGSYSGVLPTRLRVASGFAALFFYPAVVVLVLDSGGVIDVGWGVGPPWMWVIAGFFALGALANVVSRSRIERIWAPVSAVIAFCCGVIAVAI
jgi:hypothetical protein